MKHLRVLLCFHAHEPLWDLPRRLGHSSRDRRVRNAIVPESYIRRRMREGRNVYRDLVGFAERRGFPVVLDATNELLFQLRKHAPGTYRELSRAYRRGSLYPLYTAAHHTHAVLLSPEELTDELRLNRELLHGDLGAPQPLHRGLFFTECSVDARLVPAVERAGFEFTLCPDLDPARVHFSVEPQDYDVHHRPFRLGTKLVGLPRHFAVSQEIWRPISLRESARLRYQGFLLGEFPVFFEEYQAGRPLEKADPEVDAVGRYADVLRKAIADAPDGGLLLYIQDLELMDFGEQALAILDQAWSRVMDEKLAAIEMVTPDTVMAGLDVETLPRVDLLQASWAPEIRPALRYDGHYPPRGAGPFRGYDAAEEIFKRRPFVFWEPGRPINDLFGWLLGRFDFPTRLEVSAQTLIDEDYHLERFPPHVRLPALVRLMKRACNWGWYPEEGLNKRPYLDGLLVLESLRLELRLRGEPPTVGTALPWRALGGMTHIAALLLGTRLEYLRFGLERWREERGADPEAALLEIERAGAMWRQGEQEIQVATARLRDLAKMPSVAHWDRFLEALEQHTKAIFLALDSVQRAWGASDPEYLIVPMYTFLHDIYPPKGPDVLDAIDAIESVVSAELPEAPSASEAAEGHEEP